MNDTPIELDKHRGMAAQKATDIRRVVADVETKAKLLRDHQTEVEIQLVAAPAASGTDSSGVEGAGPAPVAFRAEVLDPEHLGVLELLGRRERGLPVRELLLRDHVAHCVEHAISSDDKADQRRKIAELMQPEYEPGKFAGWIAPPQVGINSMPVEFDYVHF